MHVQHICNIYRISNTLHIVDSIYMYIYIAYTVYTTIHIEYAAYSLYSLYILYTRRVKSY